MRFNDDMIKRTGLSRDVFSLLHDLAYHCEARDEGEEPAVWSYMRRAQHILSTPEQLEIRNG